MSQTQVALTVSGPIARITFSTGEGLNVLSTSVLATLDGLLTKVRGNRAIRVAIFQAEGKVFLAGADIKEMADYDVEAARRYGQLGSDVMNAIDSLPCVTIAAITGAALGGGLELALACDLRYAVRTARLGLPEVQLGLIPGWGGTIRLPRLVGPSRARMMILSGETVKAEDGQVYGLVDEVMNSAEDIDPRVTVVANSFLKSAPSAVAFAKRSMRDGDDLTAFADCFLEESHGREGMRAFIEKRPASYVE